MEFEFKSKTANKSVRIREVIAAHPDWSDAQVANTVMNGCTKTLVSVVRNAEKRKAAGLPSYSVAKRRREKLKAAREAYIAKMKAGKEAKKARERAREEAAAYEEARTKADEVSKKFFKENLVDNPPHYTVGGISTYDFIVAKKLSYELGNVVKYITRADYKGNRLQDLQKAQWYLNAAIKQEEKVNG